MLLAHLLEAIGSALDLVLSRACAGCEGADGPVCPDCRRELATLALAESGPMAPSPVPPGWPGCTGTLRYEGLAARLMKAYKDGDRRDLVVPLAALLADALRRALAAPPFVAGGPVLLVPIPSSPAAVRRRGDRPTSDLVRRAAQHLGDGVDLAPVLTMARGTADQAGLDAQERRSNLHAALRVRAPSRVAGRDCLLVDDILTSGATLAEGRRALLAAGAARVGMAVCMVTPRRHPAVALPFGPSSD